MRITILCPSYPPMPGGVSDFTAQFAQALTALGPEAMRPESWPLALTVITGPGAQRAPQGAETLSASFTAPEPGLTIVAEQENWGLLGLPSLLKRIRASSPDVVVLQYVPHLFQRQGFSVPIAEFVALLRRSGFKVVTVAHELYYARHEGWKVQPFGWAQRYALLPLFWGSARVVLTVPDRLTRMQRLFSRWAGKFTLLPVGPNLAPSAEGVDVAAWRARHDVPETAVVLLFLGLAHPSKELSVLTETLDALERAGINARLVLAGGGALAHAHAVNVGYLSRGDAEAALAAADLAVLPFADGASARRTSLMNALAAGLPVVSTRGVNTDPGLFPPEAVALVPAGDAAAFAEAVVTLSRDAAARRALGRAGRALLEASFSWDVLAKRWITLLEDVVYA